MYPHRIRLKGPWKLEALPGGATESTRSITATFPCRWSESDLAGFRGVIRHRRSFGLPRGLDSWERVWLTCASIPGPTVVMLNGIRLGESGSEQQPASFEITGKLTERNEVSIDVTATGGDDGVLGEIAIEIRAGAWLEDVRFHSRAGRVTVVGRACGAADQPLDAYVLVADRVAFQTMLEPTETGREFEWQFEFESPMASSTLPIAVELVRASAIWYRIEGQLEMTQPAAAP